MGIFKSSKSDLAAGPDVPIDQVMAMKQQGYSNNQIIQTLQRDGYSSSQIFDALSQSELPGTSIQDVQMQTGYGGGVPPPMQSMPGMDMGMNQGMSNNISGGMSGMSNNMSGGMSSGMQGGMSRMPGNMSGASNEELIEAVIDEKWNELVKDINKVIEWKQKADLKLQVMEQKITDMKDQFDKLHQAIIGKIGDYDKNMLNVATELQAMEKVFSKVLPTFMDNVNELTRITDNLRPDNNSLPVKKKSSKFDPKDLLSQ